ncbi:M14 family metallopeptidase [Pelomonas sp. SE-A7]|uniref:M14 family metallopeptidase n=1 Tax=Pelomonas sp. SE-A7 TaxID=3054953 RepID=UPI00259D256F|nr:M14 family metallopeptidase [Pelomonas sp. SE-A7]MDM4768519.1 M14 family metallopeptidase [Pelomonas sp. SE-A7]
MSHKLTALLAASLLAASSLAAPPSLTTVSERSGFLKTGRFDEVQALCMDFAKAYPGRVRCWEFGRTPQGRPMLALVASDSGALSPAEARKRKLPVTLIQGGIHAGEIDGKDAGFLALRQILDGRAAAGSLKKQVLVFVPVFNVDGHERFAAWNRPNQRGPEQMGWRTTAQNYNLNRDYAKADAPEMQAMLRLIDLWDPLALVDLHVTDGAKFEHDVAVQVEPVHAGDEALREVGRAWRDGVVADIAKQGSLPVVFYPSFNEDDNPASGFTDSVAPPRFSTGYPLLRNRLAMLVETHSWKDYPTRVRVTRNIVVSVLERMAAEGAAWQKVAAEADTRAAQLAGQSVALSWKASAQVREIAFRGYAYTRTPSDISGALMTRYDESKPELWKLPLRDDIVADLQVQAPKAGYLVPAEHAAWVADKLKLHGLNYRILKAPLPKAPVQAFRATMAKRGAQSVESHQRLDLQGQWAAEARDLPAGSLFVPIAQPGARLVMSLLEPLAPDSFVAWGFFNNHFERKEYMEGYVAEEVAREQLAADPALKAAFEKRIAEDAAFAKSASARLDFFARRHSSWDERFNLYPVLRTDQQP